MFREYPVTKILEELAADNLLPALIFRTARKQCDGDIERIGRSRAAELPPEQQARLRAEISAVAKKFNVDETVMSSSLQYDILVRTGAGAHHAGQLLVWRLLLEELMSRGLLRLMIATGTVAAGVDFPARSVIVSAHSRRGSDGFTVLSSSEFQQMSGRAGRRGKDAVGLCIVVPGAYSDARVIHEIAQNPPEPLRSVYFAAPATVLNLLKYRNVDDLQYTVARSFAAFLDRKHSEGIRRSAEEELAEVQERPLGGERQKKALKRVRRREREADELQHRQAHLLEESLAGLSRLGYVLGSGLTEKGYWAANLCTSLVLELGEAIADGLFDELRIEEIVGLVASIAGDPHRPYFNLKPNPLKKDLYRKMEQVVARVKEQYRNPVQSEVKVLPDAALTVITWMESASWDEFSSLLRLSGVAEGDVARLVTQTADHLNQLSRLRETHKLLSDAAIEGRKAILRPPLSDEFIMESSATI